MMNFGEKINKNKIIYYEIIDHQVQQPIRFCQVY